MKDNTENGYILESRSILESDIWFKPPMYYKVWKYLLNNAQHSNYRGLKRGQLFTSINEIREACCYYVGYRKIVPTRKEIWGIIDWLRKPHEGDTGGNDKGTMIVTTKVTRGMVVTICNYNYYQDPKNYEGNNESNDEIHTKRTRRERQGNNINKNVKNDKNEQYKKEKDKKEKSINELITELPMGIQGVFKEFVEMRKSIKAPVKTHRQFTLLVNKLNDLSGGDIEKGKRIIEQSIMNGWKSLYEVKETNKPISFMDAAEELKRLGYGN